MSSTIPATQSETEPLLFDAHNHLQDERFGGRQEELLAAVRAAGIHRLVVNGSCEADWSKVLSLSRQFAEVVPSFGYHPWYLHERTPAWPEQLTEYLNATPSAIGEIGLDRWKPDLDYEGQEEVFLAQLGLASERNCPASIHCLQAWGRMHDLLRSHPRPACGFLLHSYGGPVELVAPLAKLGAYFGFPGYFLHERKARQRDTFRHVPPERLLIETDAPDQLPPDSAITHPLRDTGSGLALNHPANLGAIYSGVASMLGIPRPELVEVMAGNFRRLFAGFA